MVGLLAATTVRLPAFVKVLPVTRVTSSFKVRLPPALTLNVLTLKVFAVEKVPTALTVVLEPVTAPVIVPAAPFRLIVPGVALKVTGPFI